MLGKQYRLRECVSESGDPEHVGSRDRHSTQSFGVDQLDTESSPGPGLGSGIKKRITVHCCSCFLHVRVRGRGRCHFLQHVQGGTAAAQAERAPARLALVGALLAHPNLVFSFRLSCFFHFRVRGIDVDVITQSMGTLLGLGRSLPPRSEMLPLLEVELREQAHGSVLWLRGAGLRRRKRPASCVQ